MKRFLLLLLSTPTAIGTILPLLVTAAPTLAADSSPTTQAGRFCISAHAKLVCVKSSQLASSKTSNSTLIARSNAQAKDPDAFVNFNDEESDAAVALFGCDCPACIRSLRQLRIMAQVS